MKLTELFTRTEACGEVVTPAGLPEAYIIAEVGVNHEGSMELAKRLIDEACEGGAHAVKFQTYKAESLASKDSPAYWDTTKEPTQSQYELFKRHDSFWKNEFEALKRHCDTAGIEFLSTPFDLASAAFLNDLMDVVKVSSSDITNKPFIRSLCGYGKPIILSTGASYAHEVMEAVSWIEESGTPLALLHCVLNYPTLDENAGLGMISALRRMYPRHVIGYSDHTLPGDMQVLESAVLLGARILEKHFTHDKSLPGNDHYHAMDKEDLKAFSASMRRIRAMIGAPALRSLPSEEPARKNARRSLVAARDIPAGKGISAEDLTFKRPAHGISPRHYDELIGMRARTTIAEDSVLQWGMLE